MAVTVTVVVPTFRRPAYLAEALHSLRGQSFPGVEVLVCDNDASPDVAALVEGLHDGRFRHVPRPENLGLTRNAIEGFRAARGRFVTKLDDDDRFAPDTLARLVAGLEADAGATVAFGRLEIGDAQGRVDEAHTARHAAHVGLDTLAPGRHAPATALVAAGTIALACAVLRRDAVDWADVPAEVATAYDRHVLLDAVRDGAAAWYDPHARTVYRRHPDSDTSGAPARQGAGSLHATAHAIASGRHDAAGAAALRAAAVETAVRTARLHLRAGRPDLARAVVRTGLRAAGPHPGGELLRLAALARLPAPVAASVARSRAARGDRQPRTV